MKRADLVNDVQRHLFELIFLTKDRMRKVLKDADAGLTPIQILILRTVAEQGELTQSQLVKSLGRDKSQITRLIHDLVDKRLLIKEQDKHDKRRYRLKAPKEVINKVAGFIRYEQNMVTEMLKGISQQELTTFDRLLIKMQQNLLIRA